MAGEFTIVGDDAVAKNNGVGRHCYRETVQLPDGSEIEAFLCGALGPPCVQCQAVSEVLCDFPIGEEGRTCDKALCLRCAPTVGVDKNFCREHLEAGAGPNMLLFKRPLRPDEIATTAELQKIVMRKPRLPRAPAPERRWRVRGISRHSGDAIVMTTWIGEMAAHAHVREHPGRFVETWDEYVAWHRKTYPLAPRKPHPKKQ